MPRTLSTTTESALDAQQSNVALLYFLTIRHPSLYDAIRAVSNPFGDNVGYHVLDSKTFAPIPFKLQIVSDDEREPRGNIEMINYGLEIGRAVRKMAGIRCLLDIAAYAAADFSVATSGSPAAHQPLGTPTRLYYAPWLTIVNIRGSTWISGDIVPYGPDLGSEPAAALRATQDILPGIFRR